jgi:flagellar basal body-associated protein FliL
MSEDKSPAPPQPPALKTQDGVISLEDLDNLMNQVDPGFNESLEAIKKEAVTDTAAIEALQVGDSQVDVGGDDEAQKPNVKKKFFALLAWPFVRAGQWLRMRGVALKYRAILFKDQSIQFVKHELPERLRYLKSLLIAGITWIKKHVNYFFALTWPQKIAGTCALLFVLAGFYFGAKVFSTQWLPTWRNPIIGSYTKQADAVWSVKDPKDYINFFQAFPEIEIPFLLTKIIVNLAPSPGSKHPMGAFEFYLGLDAKETAIEVKDREKEVIDLVQRTVEEFTYDEVMSQIGQVRMKARIRDAINSILNQGNVTKVYISTMVTNH